MLKATIEQAASVVAVSRGVAEDIGQHFVLLEGQLQVVYNPVITSDTWRQASIPLTGCPVPEGLPFFLYVGRFAHAKGLDVLVNAFVRISPITNAQLVLVGEGPLTVQLREMISRTDCGDRIHLVGYQSNPLPWMYAAKALVLPSRREGLGNVLIEALACGTQVIASDCPSGPAEILKGGRYGQLVQVGDDRGLANAMLNVVEGRNYVDPVTLRERADSFRSQDAADAYLRLLQRRYPGNG
jgi:glycosyltransferase involved in cell wall biosynthesis